MLFPEWFAAPQPDWPPNTHQIGFPLHDAAEESRMPDDLEQFLESGPPPVVVTFGSAMAQRQEVFEAAIEAALALDQRVVVASRFLPQSTHWPETRVRLIDYAPFSQLFPRCSAVLHHGGIGTLSQAIEAGRPQCVVHFSHDQPDNARRLRECGVAVSLPASRARTPVIREKLRLLLEDPIFSERAATLQKKIRLDAPDRRLMEVVNRLLSLG